MNRAVIIATIALAILQCTNTYFTYDDCNYNCKHLNISCLISEENPNFFLNICEMSEGTCELRATSMRVCIRKDQAPVGGEKIWDDFEKYIHPTTTDAPIPDNDNNEKWKVISIVCITLLSIIMLATISIIALKLYIRYRDANYVILRTIDNPYRDTVTVADD